LHVNKGDNITNLTNLCTTIDVNDEMIFNENAFFALFVYNAYLTDIYKTNKEAHFKQILITNGYDISQTSNKNKLCKKKLNDMKAGEVEYIDKKFNEHITEVKYDEMIDINLNFLNLLDEIEQVKYKDIILDKYLRDDYLNLIRLFYSDEILNAKYNKFNNNNVEYKTIFSNYNKIRLLKKLEVEANINRFDIEHKEIDEPINISEELYLTINTAFRSKEAKPTTFNAFINYYVMKLKHILGSIKIIDKKQAQFNKKRIMKYTIDEPILKYYMDLHFKTNAARLNFSSKLLTKYSHIITVKKDINEDEDNDMI